LGTERRSVELIMSKILDICEGGAGKTKIVYQANLNSEKVDRYLERLISHGLVDKSTVGSRVIYKTTNKGTELKVKFERIHSEIRELRNFLFDAST
jgi:predicted transcriptional regulator